ncbi:hypothetical protein FFF34_016015 [Inquilinus sp. KBS0705]|nr:hypothetical protein FFF34_016015 [Inquilinus sp. KBS0705]
MKKDKRSLLKSAKKAIKNDIKLGLIAELKKLTATHVSKKLDKKIEKGAEQLAKKIAKEIKLDKLAIAESTDAKPAKVAELKTAAPAVKKAATAKPVKDAPVPSAS